MFFSGVSHCNQTNSECSQQHRSLHGQSKWYWLQHNSNTLSWTGRSTGNLTVLCKSLTLVPVVPISALRSNSSHNKGERAQHTDPVAKAVGSSAVLGSPFGLSLADPPLALQHSSQAPVCPKEHCLKTACCAHPLSHHPLQPAACQGAPPKNHLCTAELLPCPHGKHLQQEVTLLLQVRHAVTAKVVLFAQTQHCLPA